MAFFFFKALVLVSKTKHHFSPKICTGVLFSFHKDQAVSCKYGLVLLSLNLFRVELSGKYSPKKFAFERRCKSMLRAPWCLNYPGPLVHL